MEPGSRGAVDCIEITDDDLLDFAGTDDLAEASLSFVGSLGRPSALNRILSGSDEPPTSQGRPFFFRILAFACWVQVTSLRERGQRDFRKLLSSRLGWNVPLELHGLPRMWRELRDWLACEWGIDLRLPAPGNETQIGHTIRLPFPTWRDLNALRAVRDTLPPNYLDARRVFADRLCTTGSEERRSPAFVRKFQEWERAIRVADLGLRDFAFDRAWMRVVAETVGGANVAVDEDEFGGLRLYTIDMRGAVRDIVALGNDEVASLRPSIRRAARNGSIWMAAAGFGRWVSTDDRDGAEGRLESSSLVGGPEARDLADAIPVGTSGWLLARGLPPSRRVEPGDATTDARLIARRTDGIRIGAALLGRTPMTPSYAVTGTGAFRLRSGGEDVQPTLRDDRLSFPDGIWSGNFDLVGDGRVLDSLRLLPDAIEHSAGSLKTYEAAFAIPEDGPVFGTEPVGGTFTVRRHGGPKHEHVGRMLALEEAVYAKCKRSLPLGELARLAARAIEGLVDAPSPWDILRAFVDGGWLEPAATRQAATRLLVPREPRFRVVYEGDRRLFLLDGAAAGAVRRRIIACAEAVGLGVEEVCGIGGWSPPLVVVAIGGDDEAAAELLRRTGLSPRSEVAVASPPSARWRELASTVGYEPSTVWDHDAMSFAGGAVGGGCALADAPALSKLDRPRLDQPPIYVVRRGSNEEIIFSPTLALLRHAEHVGAYPYVRSGGLLVRVLRRHHLPAAWGRWLSQRGLASAGPIRTDHGWTYAYPADAAAVRALVRLCKVARDREGPAWTKPIATSRRDDHPTMIVRGSTYRSRVGRLR